MKSLCLLALLLVSPVAVRAQAPRPVAWQPTAQVVRLGTGAAQGIDQTVLDSVYIAAIGGGTAHCRFDSTQTTAFRQEWDRFLNELMNQSVEHKVAFDEIVVRCYVNGDGYPDYIFYHVGDDPETDRRFVIALRTVAAAFRFPPASGPYRQGATITKP